MNMRNLFIPGSHIKPSVDHLLTRDTQWVVRQCWVRVVNPGPAWMSVKAGSCLNTRRFNKEVDKPSGGVAGGKRSFLGLEPMVNTLIGGS
jgi:P pilus assembly chaperone PapD